MSEQLKSKLPGLGKALLQALASGLVAWLATTTSGCTTVVIPADDAQTPIVTVTGGVPIGLQTIKK